MPEINFDPFPRLHTSRLLLRKLETTDAPAIFFLRSDEQVLRYIGREPAQTTEEALSFIRSIDSAVAANQSVLWGICLQDDPAKVIGTICLWNLQPQNHRAEIGFVLHPDWWRKGLMKEAILAVINYGFDTMLLHSIEARLDPANTACAAVLQATGFICEGHFRESFYFRGVYCDSHVYSIITSTR